MEEGPYDRDLDERDGVRKKARLSRGAKKTLAKKKQEKERTEIAALSARLASGEDFSSARLFSELPISRATLTALKAGGFTEMTSVQRASLPHSLAGRNVVGAAQTGSGKTLAFVVPLVERLVREGWAREHGVGAVVVSPTRELALQTFEVLRVVGANHGLHGGLMIGQGRDLKQERAEAGAFSVVVATPGRLLQHLDEAHEFKTDMLQMIVFDECDRLLDMGFEKTVDAILAHFPPVTSGDKGGLQCLMFSATNNRKLVSQRIANADFVDIDVDRANKNATPDNLRHFSMEATLDQKLTLLWSFIKQHLFSKMMVFVASCKQARFLEETLRRLQATPTWIGAIHGRLLQTKRMAKYYEFRKLKHGILICTDVAARGLDFPAVDWVVQMDVPENVEAYIHRVGRTARLGGQGSALMFVMPSEKSFVNKLGQKGIVLDVVEPKANRLEDPSPQIQSLLTADPDLKYLAQKAFVCYMRSVSLASDKETFDVTSLPYRAYAQSLGLITVPKIKFGKSKRVEKNAPFALQKAIKDGDKEDKEGEDGEEEGKKKSKVPIARVDKLMARTTHRKSLAEREEVEDDDDFLVLQRPDHDIGDDSKKKRGREEGDEEGGGENGEEHKTAQERRRERRMLEKKARKEKAKAKRAAKESKDEDGEKDAGDIIPDSVAAREAMALAAIDDF